MTSGGEPRTLAGRYRLDEVIGRGGMSTVYRGTDLSLDRVVAVKVALDPLVEQSPIYLARFTREAQSTAALSHPGVVTVYDAGADGPTRFIVMELVPGRSLADILRDEGPLEPARAARIAAQVADALSAAHAAGIVHRDIKPGNIMVDPRRTGEGARLRDRAGARQPVAHADRDRARHVRVHVARAGARAAGGRALGHLLARVRAVRDADRRAAVHGRRLGRGAASARAGRAQAGARAQPRDPAGARRARDADAGQVAGRPAPDRRRCPRPPHAGARTSPRTEPTRRTTVALAPARPRPVPRAAPTAPASRRPTPRGRSTRRAAPPPTSRQRPTSPPRRTTDRADAAVPAQQHRVLDHGVPRRRGAARRRRGGGADRRRLRHELDHVGALISLGHRHTHELAHDHEPAALDPSDHDLDDAAHVTTSTSSTLDDAHHVHVLHQPDDADLNHQHLGHGVRRGRHRVRAESRPGRPKRARISLRSRQNLS